MNRRVLVSDQQGENIASQEAIAVTDTLMPAASVAEREFRVGANNKAVTMLSRNLLPFSIVTGVAALP